MNLRRKLSFLQVALFRIFFKIEYKQHVLSLKSPINMFEKVAVCSNVT